MLPVRALRVVPPRSRVAVTVFAANSVGLACVRCSGLWLRVRFYFILCIFLLYNKYIVRMYIFYFSVYDVF